MYPESMPIILIIPIIPSIYCILLGMYCTNSLLTNILSKRRSTPLYVKNIYVHTAAIHAPKSPNIPPCKANGPYI
jgi:hypothetical protein